MRPRRDWRIRKEHAGSAATTARKCDCVPSVDALSNDQLESPKVVKAGFDRFTDERARCTRQADATTGRPPFFFLS